ncbi:hypothetical protein CSUI_008636 [Cystoisospora suis]|uniref:Uncharacterized protein n=1 Tax=Cystoisospora suis TaxID=483139 RepID=A0A2C6K8B1_9APIC|nr:hypothetical protein CSUI_008636 [Cystoisospora suis]
MAAAQGVSYSTADLQSMAQYPSPFPGYVEQYSDGTSSANVYGEVHPQTMARWTGGPSLFVSPLTTPQIYSSSQAPVVCSPSIPNYTMMAPGTGTFVTPEPNVLGGMSSSMQLYSQSMGGAMPFFGSTPGAAMPQGYHAAFASEQQQAQEGDASMGIRKATLKKQPPPEPPVAPVKPKEIQPQRRRKSLFCC